MPPFALPILPPERFQSYARELGLEPAPAERQKLGVLPQYFADRFGWRKMSDAVRSVYAALPPGEREDGSWRATMHHRRLLFRGDRGMASSMETKEPRSLLVLAFDSPLKSREAFLAFQRLQLEEIVVVHDAVFIEKDQTGKIAVRETIDPQPGTSAAESGLWGALLGTLFAGPLGTIVGAATSAGLGALAAKLIDIGIPDATVKELEQATPPGSSALALLLSHVKEDGLEHELKRFSGSKLIRSDLSPTTVQRLRNALAVNREDLGSE